MVLLLKFRFIDVNKGKDLSERLLIRICYCWFNSFKGLFGVDRCFLCRVFILEEKVLFDMGRVIGSSSFSRGVGWSSSG